MEIRTYIRTLATERRLAAIHEAGHVVIARSFGMVCQGEIYPTHTSDLARERTWTGRIFRQMSGKRRGRLIVPTKKQLRMIAVAGAIASTYWQNRKIVRREPRLDWWDSIWWSEMYKTDWQLAECPARVRNPDKKLCAAAKEVAALLKPVGGQLWPSLLLIARELIEDSRELPGGDILTLYGTVNVPEPIHVTPN